MPDYRRNRVPGGSYFFTVNLRDRRSDLLITHIESLRRVVRETRGIWQRRYWKHTIRDERDYAAHMDYIHFNPVKHGFVQDPGDWAFSTFHRCVAAGMYPAQWRGDGGSLAVVGERADPGVG